MAIHTPNGLKIRLDEGRVERVLAPVSGRLNIGDVFMDVELWANFPGAVSSTCAIATALLAKSWLLTIVAALIAFCLSNFLQQLFYSRSLKVLFPQFLGAWMIALPVSVVVGVYLFYRGYSLVAVTQLGVVIANWFGITDFILLFLTPLRVGLKRLFGLKLGDVELAFVQITSQKARQLGVELDWDVYNRRET